MHKIGEGAKIPGTVKREIKGIQEFPAVFLE
jgi:hypothetical protein